MKKSSSFSGFLTLLFSSLVLLLNGNLFLLPCVNCKDWWNSSLQWGSYTPYPGIKSFLYGKPSLEAKQEVEKSEECPLVYVFGYFRHGTRLPTENNIRKLHKIAEKVKMACNNEADSIHNEIPPYCRMYMAPVEYKDGGSLTTVGKNELNGIGKRLNEIIDPALMDIEIITSTEQRAKDSAIHFFRGFNPTIRHYNTNDKLVRYYKGDKATTSLPQNDFLFSEIWNETLANVSKLLKFSVKTDDLLAIFSGCALGKSNGLKDEIRMWCSIIPPSSLDAILYAEDAKDYWQLQVYPQNITDPIFSLFLSNLTKIRNETINSTETIKKRITVLFGHEGGIFPLIHRLNFHQQTYPLNAENYHKFVKNRSFNNTRLTPMASNIQLHVYLCNKTQLYFQPFLNEISMLNQVNCQGKTFIGCPENTFSSILQDSNESGNVKTISLWLMMMMQMIFCFLCVMK